MSCACHRVIDLSSIFGCTENVPDLRVVVLVRDPRAVFHSRWSERISAWCRSAQCADPGTSCADLAEDVTAARQLMAEFPGRVTLLRYEDLSLDTAAAARRLVRALGLPWHAALEAYIRTHTRPPARARRPGPDPYGTVRDSAAAVVGWAASLSAANVSRVEAACSAPMGWLGYPRLPPRPRGATPPLQDILAPRPAWAL